ncbi:multiple sugar transport system substrate-binding protein [Fontibacillus panacisegetis]|uniref:Multiple sugar transport system substrate-binding protein n=1 Tax=Fontibacillus panacisegetis TaxID=670482 RepID=A0A1G7PP32_9BACL|nr:extracellular solute-binding protein [Fontibacillus panacisegetis]SDF88152.1 multiple sugar transport system substrate-binding protein [Fontibacillus panacisegetis]
MRKRLIGILMVVLLLTLLSSACSSTEESIHYEGDPKMTATIKLMALGSKDDYMKRYIDIFNSKFPNIEIQYINYLLDDAFMKKLQEEKPDVLILFLDQYMQLTEENRLYDLSTLLANDDFDLEGIHPEIVAAFREMGKGKLYGLPPNFQSQALYYNKDLFDRYGIPYPQDRMTWEEVIQLAKRFPAEDGISGLYMQDFNTLVDEISWTKNLRKVNEKDMQVTLNSDSYKQVFDLIFDAYKSNHIVVPGLDPFDINDPFLSGTSAMTVDYYYYMYHKIGGAKMKKGADYHLNWDIVTVPVDESDRNSSPSFMFGGIFSINADSEQKQAAWEFVKFVNSEEFAKAKSRTIESMPLPSTRTEFIYNPEGKHMEAFYILKPKIQTFINYDLFPNRFFSNLKGIVNSEGKAVWAGVKTPEEAIASMQERAQKFLDENAKKKD